MRRLSVGHVAAAVGMAVVMPVWLEIVLVVIAATIVYLLLTNGEPE